MGFSVQNSETGEVVYIQSDTMTVQTQPYDAETGEPMLDKVRVRYIKQQHFQIPKKLIRGTIGEEFEKKLQGKYHECYQEPGIVKIIKETKLNRDYRRKSFKTKRNSKKLKYKRDDYMNMEGVSNDIILAYNKSNYRILLIPTLFCFNVYAALVVMLIELFFHIWAHFKNGLNMDKNIYYRSPLHVVTSQFCGKCRSESDLSIFQALNKQMRNAARKSATLKDVSKAIS
uniref:Uncharacterized protein n=1 Tax=Glossina morsitans morsitans TaxID=37546 RepID=A0A1B0FGL6_GLOMM